VVAGCAAAFWGWLFYGLQDFLTPLVEGENFATHYLTETGWGLTYLVLTAVPLAVLAVLPGSAVALLQVTAVGVALGVGALLAGSLQHLMPAVGVLITAALLTWLGRAEPPVRPHRPAPVSSVIAAVAVVPGVAYAWDMARSTKTPEKTWGLDHYPVQAALVIAIVLIAVLAAYIAASHDRGRWLPALCAAFAAGWIGSLSVVWPARLGSLGTAWGLTAVAWGVVLVTAVGLEGRPHDQLSRAQRVVRPHQTDHG
jgi:hypothetical protein